MNSLNVGLPFVANLLGQLLAKVPKKLQIVKTRLGEKIVSEDDSFF